MGYWEKKKIKSTTIKCYKFKSQTLGGRLIISTILLILSSWSMLNFKMWLTPGGFREATSSNILVFFLCLILLHLDPLCSVYFCISLHCPQTCITFILNCLACHWHKPWILYHFELMSNHLTNRAKGYVHESLPMHVLCPATTFYFLLVQHYF